MEKIEKMKNRMIFRHFRVLYWLYAIIPIVSVILLSCQKVIPIDLNSVSPIVVFEGNVTNLPGPYYVRISKTVNFDESNVFPKVSGAKVVISDTLGNVDTLKETSTGSGVYSTSRLQGVPGRTYTFTAVVEGVEYKAVSSMPIPVNIDSLKIVNENNFGRNVRKAIEVTFRDPAGIPNYYRFEEIVNDYQSYNYSLLSDRYLDGKTVIRDVNVNDSTDLQSGDFILFEMQCIDKATYDYFRTLRFATGSEGLGILSPSPANPISNFSNGAMGYFSAYSITSKSIIVP